MSTVTTQTGEKLMKDLAIGDHVLAGEFMEIRVDTWISPGIV